MTFPWSKWVRRFWVYGYLAEYQELTAQRAANRTGTAICWAGPFRARLFTRRTGWRKVSRQCPIGCNGIHYSVTVPFNAWACLKVSQNGELYSLGQSKRTFDATIGLAGVEVAREWAACIARRLPRLFPRNHASLEAGDDAVDNGLVDAWSAGCIAMVAVCHDVLLSCAARVGRDCEGGLFASGSQPNFFC